MTEHWCIAKHSVSEHSSLLCKVFHMSETSWVLTNIIASIQVDVAHNKKLFATRLHYSFYLISGYGVTPLLQDSMDSC